MVNRVSNAKEFFSVSISCSTFYQSRSAVDNENVEKQKHINTLYSHS